jgi:hypothetical protein
MKCCEYSRCVFGGCHIELLTLVFNHLVKLNYCRRTKHKKNESSIAGNVFMYQPVACTINIAFPLGASLACRGYLWLPLTG